LWERNGGTEVEPHSSAILLLYRSISLPKWLPSVCAWIRLSDMGLGEISYCGMNSTLLHFFFLFVQRILH